MDYQIQKGDSLWKIAQQQYGLQSNNDIARAVEILAQQNGLADANLIIAGASLKLPENLFDEPHAQQEPAAQAAEPQAPAEDNTLAQTLATAFDSWLDKQNEATDAYIAKLDGLVQNNDPNAVELYAQYEQEYLAAQDQIGDFTFISEGVNVKKDDGTTDFDLYAQEGKKFAEALTEHWEKDDEEGISYEEYRTQELKSAGLVDADAQTEAIIQKGFNMMDLNGDEVLSTDEIQSVYSVIDMADGNADGAIDINSFSSAIDAAEVIKQNAIQFQQKLAE